MMRFLLHNDCPHGHYLRLDNVGCPWAYLRYDQQDSVLMKNINVLCISDNRLTVYVCGSREVRRFGNYDFSDQSDSRRFLEQVNFFKGRKNYVLTILNSCHMCVVLTENAFSLGS